MKKLFLLIAFCCFAAVASFVFAQANVGLKQGDWIEYDVKYTGSPPESHPDKIRIDVQAISGTNITVEIGRNLLNGTQDSKTVTFDLEIGAPDLIVIPANLSVGDFVYHSDIGNFTLEGIEDYNYKGVTRERVYATVVRTEFSWDRLAGIVVKAYHTTDTFTETLEAVDTNIVWIQSSEADQMLLYAVIVTVAIIIALIVLFAFRIRKNGSL